MLLFEQLPCLVSLSISGAREGSIVCRGRASQLRRLEITFSSEVDWETLRPTLGCDLEEVIIADCDFAIGRPEPLQWWPSLQRLHICDSNSAVTLLDHVQIPPDAEVHVRINPADVHDSSLWSMILHALDIVPVTVSFSSHPDLSHSYLLRLRQLASLDTVQIDKADCSWFTACLRELEPVGDCTADVQLTDLDQVGQVMGGG
ncbi:hypothetical protein CBS147347_11470 [Aspergillus niger]|nr:hypothetical protein CBS147347_11470 [Aspergillus niger]